MRYTYWSCSKFAGWLRGTPKPGAGTSKEWSVWEKTAKVKKMRYWLAEKGLKYLQDFLNWPMDRISDLRYYIKNRWISKTHALTSSLKRGQWYDFDTRLLYCIFDELLDFVEVEQAWMHVAFSDEEQKKYKIPWHRSFFRIGVWRSPEAGLAYLDWATGLKADEEWMDKNDPDYGKPTRQALAAKETIALYKWWKDERPKRLDPMDASGWSDLCEERHKTAVARGEDPLGVSLGEDATDEERERSEKILGLCHKMEQEQEAEDTEMLIRLVRLRSSLWT